MPRTMAPRRLLSRYGLDSSQEGELFLPEQRPRGVVVLLHGGFWMVPYDRHQLDGLALALAARGWAAWNLEYRRLGEEGGGWPGTFEDVARGVAHLATLAETEAPLPLDRVVLAGHSAGGHLALWAAGADTDPVRPSLVVALAPLSDLAQARTRRLGGGIVDELLAGTSVAQASPMERLPVRVPMVVAHGEEDEGVPVAMSEDFATRARAAGSEVTLLKLPRTGHFEFLEPGSAATRAWLERLEA